MPEKSALDELYQTPPKKDEIEVTIIGPGFGETVLIHIGDDKWFVIDSCKAISSDRPAPLQYLNDIKADPANVFGIVVSHWDDDHCRGMADLAATCTNAEIILSKAFIDKDFQAYIKIHDTPLTRTVRSGVKEIRSLTRLLDEGQRSALGAYPNRRLFGADALPMSHGCPVELWSLSPSDAEYQNFLSWAASQMGTSGETRRVAVNRDRNDLSVVIYVSVGDDVLLFGGDLEEEGNHATGWSAILAAKGRPSAKAQVFKIPHHGSKTGHHDDVPTELLAIDPIVIVAPFKNGNVSLPTQQDVDRIRAFAPKSFTTATLSGRANPKRDPAIEKTIREVTRRFTTLKAQPGMVRLRKQSGLATDWRVERFGSAGTLDRIFS